MPHPYYRKENAMNNELMDLLLKIESLNTEDLKKVKLWTDFNLDKRKESDHE